MAATDEAIAQRIIDLEKQRGAALIAGDLAAFGKLLSDDCVYAHGSGRVDSKASYIDRQRAGEAQFLSIDYEDLRVRVYHGVVAVLTGRLRSQVRQKTGIKANDHRFQSVWVRSGRDGDEWLFASHAGTPIS